MHSPELPISPIANTSTHVEGAITAEPTELDQGDHQFTNQSYNGDWRFCIAPMLDWTDRHCRYFHRLLSPKTRLYTEMVTTGAIRYGNAHAHLAFNEEEHPVALQLGGSDPHDLAFAARLAQQYGYDEVNLNCGCPSPRVQKGAFGACLMLQAQLVADCLNSMQDQVDIPVTVKHRIGVDRNLNYDFVRDFVGEIRQRTAVRVFIVHARAAWLDGLSPKQNRDIPPLNYDFVVQLKRDFPDCVIILNGGLTALETIVTHCQRGIDGVMVGRHAFENPAWIAQVGHAFLNEDHVDLDRVFWQMAEYATHWQGKGGYLGAVTKPMLGLYRGRPGSRLWRQIMSDHRLLKTLPAKTLFSKAYLALVNSTPDGL